MSARDLGPQCGVPLTQFTETGAPVLAIRNQGARAGDVAHWVEHTDRAFTKSRIRAPTSHETWHSAGL